MLTTFYDFSNFRLTKVCLVLLLGCLGFTGIALALYDGQASWDNAGTSGIGTPVGGPITSDTTWTLGGSPYIVSDNVIVNGGATLTIEPGVEVRFGQDGYLAVGSGSSGTLVAQGNPGSEILFTSDSATPAPGDWRSIEFFSGDVATAILEHVIVEYAGSSGSFPAAVYVDGASALIKDTTIRDSRYHGIKLLGASSLLELDSVNIENAVWEPIYVDSGGLSIKDVTTIGTLADYSISMPAKTVVSVPKAAPRPPRENGGWATRRPRPSGPNGFDKPVRLRGATISEDLTWLNLGTPYVALEDIRIAKNGTTASTLTIEAGTEIRFGRNTRLHVGFNSARGNLIARGRVRAPVVFTSNQVAKSRGYWFDIYFTAWSDNSLLDHAVVEYGGGVNTANITVSGGTPTIQNTTVRESANYGVNVYGAGTFPNLKSSTLRDNSNFGVYVTQSAGLGLENMTFAGTETDYAIDMPASTVVATAGTHSFDKPVRLRGADIVSDLTWYDLGTPCVSGSSITIRSGATLSIQPGVELRMGQGTSIYVGWASVSAGDLIAQGTAADPILITSNQDVKTPGYWNAIVIAQLSSPKTLLDHVTLEYGGYNPSGMVSIVNSSPTIKNCTLRESNNYGIHVDHGQASPIFRANNFFNAPSYAVFNNTANVLDARASYWDDPSGPSGAGPGTGEGVSTNVMYLPWLETPQNPLYVAQTAEITREVFNKNESSTTFNAILSAQGNWTLQAINSGSSVVKTYTGSGGSVGQIWSGEQDGGGGGKVPDGVYTLRLQAADSSTGQTMAHLVGRVRVEGGNPHAPVAVLKAPSFNAVLQGGSVASVRGTAKDANDFVSYRVEYGEGASPSYWTTITSPPEITTPVKDGELVAWDTSGLGGSTYTLRLITRDASSPPSEARVTVRLFNVLSLRSSESHISPNGDHLYDSTALSGTVNMPGDWSVDIKDPGSVLVRSFNGTGTNVQVVWDGKDESGSAVPDGVYSLSLGAVETSSGTEAIPVGNIVEVDLTSPHAVITAPTDSEVLFNTISITGTANDPNFASYRLDYHRPGSLLNWFGIDNSNEPVVSGLLGEWRTNSYVDDVPIYWDNGTYTIKLEVMDRAGNTATDEVEMEVDNLYITHVSASNSLIRPLLAETTEILFDLNKDVSDAKVRLVPEVSPWKIYPDQTPEDDAVRTFDLGSLTQGRSSILWDGKDDAGQYVPDEAYIFVIEGQTSSGRFDRFNRFSIDYTNPYPPHEAFPSDGTAYNPFLNEFISYTFEMTRGPARGSFRVEYRDSSGATHQLWPVRDHLFSIGSNTVSWDGRDDQGNIITDIRQINYLVCGFIPGCDPCSDEDRTSFHWVKTNYIEVEGVSPEIPLVSIKSDPYLLQLSYGEVAALCYNLADDVHVTVVVKAPDGSSAKTLLSGEPQTMGGYEVVWDGTDSGGELVSEEGDYTFTVTVTNPHSGRSTSRKGNIIVRK